MLILLVVFIRGVLCEYWSLKMKRKLQASSNEVLKEEAFAVDVANDGEEGMFKADVNEYDLIVLDVMLPKKDGICVCRELRKKGNQTPILMLTARDAVEDKVQGLNVGADDYLIKPFAFEEFLARVRSLLRRNRKDKTTQLKLADLELDQLRHKAKRAGKEN